MKGGVSQTSWAGGQFVQLKIWLLREKKEQKQQQANNLKF